MGGGGPGQRIGAFPTGKGRGRQARPGGRGIARGHRVQNVAVEFVNAGAARDRIRHRARIHVELAAEGRDFGRAAAFVQDGRFAAGVVFLHHFTFQDGGPGGEAQRAADAHGGVGRGCDQRNFDGFPFGRADHRDAFMVASRGQFSDGIAHRHVADLARADPRQHGVAVRRIREPHHGAAAPAGDLRADHHADLRIHVAAVILQQRGRPGIQPGQVHLMRIVAQDFPSRSEIVFPQDRPFGRKGQGQQPVPPVLNHRVRADRRARFGRVACPLGRQQIGQNARGVPRTIFAKHQCSLVAGHPPAPRKGARPGQPPQIGRHGRKPRKAREWR